MNYTVPHYFSRFSCTASECPDTCCAGWTIVIDEMTLGRYRRIRGPLGSRLKNCIDWKEKSFEQYERRCAFLNENQLCDLYEEAGPHMLCKTCRNYPRHIEEFEGLREISLSLSCLEAAGLILGSREPVRFLKKEMGREETYDEFDSLLFTKLADSRELLIAVMQNRSLDSHVRMGICLGLGHDLQARIRRNRLFEIDFLLNRYQGPGATRKLSGRVCSRTVTGKERFRLMRAVMVRLSHLECLQKSWSGYLKEKLDLLYEKGPSAYGSIRQEFLEYCREDQEFKESWSVWCEQLMVYFLFTYFCGAVYDGQALSKVKLAVVSTLAIQELGMAVWKENGGSLTLGEIMDIAHRYSREVEHSDDNLCSLEQMFRREEELSMRTILCILVS